MLVFLLIGIGVTIAYTHNHPLAYNYVSGYLFNTKRRASTELAKHLTHEVLQSYMIHRDYRWMRDQIHGDIRGHNTFSQKSIADVFAQASVPHNKLVRIRIKNNNVYIKKPYAHVMKSGIRMQRSILVILNVLEDMCARGLLPDVDFILSCQDRPEKTDCMEGSGYPIFAFSKDTQDSFEKGLILFPDFENIVMAYAKMPALYASYGNVQTFEKKVPVLLFRGADSDVTGYRHRLVSYAADKSFIDAEIVTHNHNRGKSMEIPQQVRYKYNISVDGVTATWTRVVWLLATDTLMLKHRSSRYQWFYGGLKPNTHYVEISDHPNDLPNTFAWLEAHPLEVKACVENGRAFYKKNLQMQGIYGYIYVLMHAYHSKQRSQELFTLDKDDHLYGLWKRKEYKKKSAEPSIIYKILTQKEWRQFQKRGIFQGSAFDKASGFMHCSTKEQIAQVREKFFTQNEKLVLVHLDVSRISRDRMKFESNKPGGMRYPHVYENLLLSTVVNSESLR
ncbi:MAG: DUF952 domain-containing protein [Alphaproteobacteria bacterium]|nr:MAG: DUF952 domain-containing protein [Alphaproteobacteria bacterium]